MRARLGTLLVTAGLAAALASAASGASSATSVGSDVSSNWAGYVATATTNSVTGATDALTTVTGNWVQPKAKCSTAAGATGATSSAFWVGLGGDLESSTALEQIGTEADCTANGTAHYFAWRELVPAASQNIDVKVAPGDRMSASVHVNGTKVQLELANLTTGKSYSRVLTMAAPDTTSAEWIAEAPSLCDSVDSSRCQQAPLTDFGKIAFTHASVTDENGHTGTISDPAWSASALQLDASDGFGYGHFGSEAAPTKATPTALTTTGAGFSVSWSSVQQPSGGYGGGGYGRGGYGDGGYGGGGYGGGYGY